MSKFELIEAIRELNGTASVEFLSQFEHDELTEYLEHLRDLDRSELTAAIASVPYS